MPESDPMLNHWLDWGSHGNKIPIMDNVVHAALYRLFKPLVRLLVRKGMAHKELGDLMKRVYVDVSEEELIETKGKATSSAIAIMTGLTRKEVAALRGKTVDEGGHSSRYNRAVRVISGWKVDSEFTTARGKPRVLPLHGEEGTFEALVEKALDSKRGAVTGEIDFAPRKIAKGIARRAVVQRRRIERELAEERLERPKASWPG